MPSLETLWRLGSVFTLCSMLSVCCPQSDTYSIVGAIPHSVVSTRISGCSYPLRTIVLVIWITAFEEIVAT